MTWAAVILAGGRGSRLGYVDKATLETDGRSLLEHALAAVAGAAEVVVVGDPVAISTPARFVREEPAGSGPLAAAAAGVAVLTSKPDLVVVLAVDMPGVTVQTVGRLLDAAPKGDGAWLTDSTGRRQPAGAVRPAVLAGLKAEGDDLAGRPLRLLLEVPGTVGIPAVGHEADDVDTWDDVARWRGLGAVQTGHPDPLSRTARDEQNEPVNLHDWIDELCDVLDIEAEVDEALVLDLAKVVADNVERPAAPITAYLVGYAAGAAEADAEGVEGIAARAQVLAEQWDQPSGAADIEEDDEVPDDSSVDHTNDRYDV